jgi:hypothetical protein
MYRSKQNGIGECANCTIVKMATNMIHAQNLNKSFWWWQMWFIHVIGVHIRTQPFITPKETWNGRRPYIVHMRVFVCIAFAMVLNDKNINSMQKTSLFVPW